MFSAYSWGNCLHSIPRFGARRLLWNSAECISFLPHLPATLPAFPGGKEDSTSVNPAFTSAFWRAVGLALCMDHKHT